MSQAESLSSQAVLSNVSNGPDQSPDTTFGLTAVELSTLKSKCIEAKKKAYCPYSKFHVGCSILTNSGTIITGANVENASYPVGTCAERIAMGSAVVKGYRMGDFKAIAVATDTSVPGSPCGMCRQFLREFCELSTPVFMHNNHGDYIVKTIGELLPMSFGPNSLPSPQELDQINKEEYG